GRGLPGDAEVSLESLADTIIAGSARDGSSRLYLSWWLSSRRFQVATLVELVGEGPQAGPQLFGRLRLVPGVPLDRLVDRLHLQVAQADWPLGQPRRANELPPIEVLGQMRGINRSRVAKNGRMLDDVGQFADVAWPDVT